VWVGNRADSAVKEEGGQDGLNTNCYENKATFQYFTKSPAHVASKCSRLHPVRKPR